MTAINALDWRVQARPHTELTSDKSFDGPGSVQYCAALRNTHIRIVAMEGDMRTIVSIFSIKSMMDVKVQEERERTEEIRERSRNVNA